MKKSIFSITYLILCSQLYSQIFPTYPTNQGYKIIESEHFDIIYPRIIEQEAQRVANLCEYVFPYEYKSMNIKKWTRMPLILSNQNITSNAYVTLAIRKSEWYNTPLNISEGGGTEWYQDLALHEMRHMFQFEKTNTNGILFNIPNFILGEFGQAATLLFFPPWFYEGDAVVTETALSNNGRGRLPNFSINYRSLILDNQKFEYNKFVYQSYKNFYPNHYILGYWLSGYLRKTYGTDIWNKLYKNFNWQSNLIKIANKSINNIWNDFWNDLKKQTFEQIKNIDTTKYKYISNYNKEYTQEENATFVNDSTILFIKYSLTEPKTLIIKNINSNEEKKIGLYNGINYNNLQISKNNTIVWVEDKSSITFTEKNYGEIIVYDIIKKTKKNITKNGKYINAIINKEGNKILAVSFNEERQCFINLIDIKTNKIIKKLKHNPDNFISNISFNNNKIAYTQTLRNNENEIIVYDLDDDNKETILNSNRYIFSNLIFSKNNDKIFYHSTYSGIDNIYAYNMNTKMHYQITSDKIGANFPTLNNNNLIYSHFTSLGNRIVYNNLDSTKWRLISEIKPLFINYFDTLKKQEQDISILDNFKNIKLKNYNSHKFNNLSKFRFHSWYFDFNKITFIGNDLLNFMSINPFVGITSSENQLITGFNLIYKRFFPIVILDYTYLNRSSDYTIYVDNREVRFNNLWSQNTINIGLSFPLNFSQANHKIIVSYTPTYSYLLNYKYLSGISLYRNLLNYYVDKKLINITSHIIQNNITFSHTNNAITQADILPKNSQTISITHKQVIAGDYINNINSNQITVSGNFILPAFTFQDRIIIVANAELKNTTNSIFTQNFNYPKGYTNLVFQNLYSGSFNYLTPPLNIDFVSPNWLKYITLGVFPRYIKTIRLNLFYDLGTYNYIDLNKQNKQKNIYSTGADLIFQIYYFQNPLINIPIAFRFAYTPNNINLFYIGVNLGLNF